MAWVDADYDRSMNLTIIKTNNEQPPSVTYINENGLTSFDGISGVTIEQFQRLTLSEFNTRLDSWKTYIFNKYSTSDPGLYESIDFTKTRIEGQKVSIRAYADIGLGYSLLEARLIGKVSGDNFSTPQNLVITVFDTHANTNIVFEIHAGDMTSGGVQVNSIQDLDVNTLTIEPNIYSVEIDINNEW